MGTQLVKVGDLYRGAFSTNGTGGSTPADSLPTAVLNRNGADDTTVAVTVAQISTSARYNYSFTVPGTYSAGDFLVVWGTVVVGGVTNVSPIASFRVLASATSLDAMAVVLNAFGGHAGTAQGGASQTITMDTGASAANNAYLQHEIILTGGTGSGESRTITAYNGTTKVATVDRAWDTNPDNTTTFATLRFPTQVPTAAGLGPNLVAITVNDGNGNLIQGADISLLINNTTFSAATNTSGVATFSLMSGTYTASMSATGYEFTPTTVSVTANPTAATLSMTAVNITAAGNAAQTTAYTTTYDAQGNVMPHVLHTFTIATPTTGDARANQFTASSDGNGLLQVTLLKNQSYQYKRGSGVYVPFTTGSAGTFALPSILGLDAN